MFSLFINSILNLIELGVKDYKMNLFLGKHSQGFQNVVPKQPGFVRFLIIAAN